MTTSQPFSLTGQVVLLTGGAGFLGQHFAGALRAAGATVVVTDITPDVALRLDVTDQASVDQALAEVLKKHGRLDVVVNAAAIDPKIGAGEVENNLNFVNYPEDHIQQSFDINVLGTWRVCKAAVRIMLVAGSGTIVNVASFYGVTPPRHELYPAGVEKPVDYPMGKAAVIMLTRHIASQFGRQGIRANVLAPGGVLKSHDDAFKTRYASHTSLGRMSAPEEVADALVFLASPASRGMTGETLVVDAGWSSR